MNGFKYKTNWCVITGAPSSGKTSVIKMLKERGYAVTDEVARELIEASIQRGRKLDDIRKDVDDLQRGILQLGLAREMALDVKALTFMDRGLPDSLTYLRLAGLETLEAETMAHLFQYRAVFIFDRLPIVKDAVRTEDDAIADKIDRMLEEDYRRIGYTPIRVPVISIDKRTDLILSHIL